MFGIGGLGVKQSSMEQQPIPSPFQFDSLNQKVAESPIDMNTVIGFINGMKIQLNLKGVFIVLKTSQKHHEPVTEGDDGFIKVVMNEKFSPHELRELCDIINKQLDSMEE